MINFLNVKTGYVQKFNVQLTACIVLFIIATSNVCMYLYTYRIGFSDIYVHAFACKILYIHFNANEQMMRRSRMCA